MSRMGKLDHALNSLLGEVEQESGGTLRKQTRALEVRDRYREVIKSSYPTTFQMVLDHTNSVYILKKDDENTLIVYVDESIFAAELNAQRELMKLKFKEMFGEQIGQFDIYVSRGKYKKQHPFARSEEDEELPEKTPLTNDERKIVEELSEMVEDDRVRIALERAMTANFEHKNR